MNEFMWFIYLADVIPALGRFCTLLATVVGLAVVLIVSGAGGFLIDSGAFSSNDEDAKALVKLWKRFLTAGITSFLIASGLAIVVPDKQTIYAMAAVKAAEELSRTDIAIKAKDAIELTLDDIIKKHTPKKEKEGK